MKKLYALIVVMSFVKLIFSQTSCTTSTIGNCISSNTIQIGFATTANNNTTYPSVYGNWYKSARHQILFLSNELLAAGVLPGKISSISFNVAVVSGTTTYPNFSIKMKCTNATDLSANTMDSIGLSQVYFTPTQSITTGWNTHNFQTAYDWDGTSNILIDVCNDFTALYSNNSSVPYTITPFISVRWFNSDVTPACITNQSSSYAQNNTFRPNVIFGNCGLSTSIKPTTKPLSTISIFPNPSNGLFTISNTINTDKFEVTIINTLGQTVIQEYLKNTKQTFLDLSKLSKGIYYVKVTTDEGTQLFKLILE